MDYKWLIFNFVLLMFVICGVIIFVLRWVFVSSTEGAIKRLNDEISKATAKQNELSAKLRQADEELAKRQAEAKALTEKMRTDAEQESKGEREKIIAKARQEGEEIIAKAQGAKEKIFEDMRKENDVRVLKFSMDVINAILNQKAKGALEDILISDFLNNLKNVDMTMISPDVSTAELVTLNPVTDRVKIEAAQIIKDKLNRSISVQNTTNPKLGGGAILKFGSMALDGSIQNAIREVGTDLQKKIETKII